MARVDYVVGRIALKRMIMGEKPISHIDVLFQAAEILGREQLGAVTPAWIDSEEALLGLRELPKTISPSTWDAINAFPSLSDPFDLG